MATGLRSQTLMQASEKQSELKRTHLSTRHVGLVCICLTAVFLVNLPQSSLGGDWPQILGPNRNGHAQTERLAEGWPTGVPQKAWQYELGSGYAGPAVADGHVFIFHRIEDNEQLDCISANSGRRLWQTVWPTNYRGGVDPDQGPRCVPLVHNGRVFVHGVGGELHCVQLQSGQKLWSRELAREYSAKEGYFGVGNTPIVIADRLMVNVGGERSSGIVALDPGSGKTLWTATAEDASYSAPTTYLDQGETRALFVTRLNVVGLRPQDGTVLFRFPFGRRGPTVNAATPIMVDEQRVFLTSSYRIGAALLHIEGHDTQTIWTSDDAMSSQYPTPIHHRDHLYGIHGREDGPPAEMRCVHAISGRVLWKKAGFGMAHLILADDKLLALKTGGQLLLLTPTSEAYRELTSARISTNTTRALPALSEGRFFFRENRGDRGRLVCLVVGE